MDRRFEKVRTGVAALLLAAFMLGCAKSPEGLLDSAKEQLANNDRSAAIIQLRNALQKNPDLAEARFLLGKTLLETDDFANAEKELRKALELKYPADQTVPLIATSLVARRDYQKTVDEFGKTKLGSPEASASLDATLAKARMGLGDVQGAKASIEDALKAKSDHPPSMIGEARIVATGGDLAKAMTITDAAVAKDPKLVEGWQLKGDLHLAQHQTDQAIAAYRKALEAKPDYLPAHYMIVVQLVRAGKKEEADKQFQAMQKIAPKHPQTYYVQALLAYRDKNYTAARDAIQQQLKLTPDNLLGLVLGAQVNFQLGAYAQVETVLTSVVQRNPDYAFARRLLIQTYLRERKPGKAREALQPLLGKSNTDSDTLALAGEVYLQNGDADTAAGYFEKAAALDPKNPGKRAAMGISHLAKGERERGLGELEAAAAEDTGIRAEMALVAVSMRQQQFDAALAAIDSIEKKQPNTPLPHSLRGGVLLAKRDAAGARQSFERALAIDPGYFPAVANLARLDLAEKKPDEARKRYEALVSRDPKNTQAILALAAVRADTGAPPDEVAALIGKAITANPADPQPRRALMLLWVQKKDPKKAVVAAQDALAAFPDRPEILDTAGQVYRMAEDNNQAIKTYNRLAQAVPESPIPFVRMAEIQIAAKEPDAAIESLRKALALQPDQLDAQKMIFELYLKGGRDKDALAVARDVQKQRPKQSVGYLFEGQIHASKRAWRDAANVYRAGLKESPTSDMAIYLYAALDNGGLAAEANTFATSWLKQHPKDRSFRLTLAQKATNLKDYKAAVAQYKAVLEENPEDAVTLNNLAWTAGKLNDPRAIEYAEKADRLLPNSPPILDTLGMLLVEKGETARGIELLQRAAALSPNAAAIRLNLASALARNGQKDAAKRELEALSKLGPKYASQADTARTMLGL